MLEETGRRGEERLVGMVREEDEGWEESTGRRLESRLKGGGGLQVAKRQIQGHKETGRRGEERLVGMVREEDEGWEESTGRRLESRLKGGGGLQVAKRQIQGHKNVVTHTDIRDLLRQDIKNVMKCLHAVRSKCNKGRALHHYETVTPKTKLAENKALVHMDFSENYSLKYAEETQSFHFGGSQQQISLHTVVVYSRESNEELTTKCFSTLSESLQHDVPAIWAHLQPVLNYTENNYEVDTLHLLNSTDSSHTKKHKKHKHKKHKKKKLLEESEGSQDLSLDDGDPTKPMLKLKLKFPKDGVPDKTATPPSSSEKTKAMPFKAGERSGPVGVGTSPKSSSKKKKSKGKDSGTSSEEERWLDAIESGKLEEVDDELKKIKPKDPKLMTARQRAMFERKSDKEPSPGGEQLLALPSGYKEKVMTAEAIQKAALKSQKRKQLADEKREKDKKKTMERLLKKQDSKNVKNSNKCRSLRKQVPRVTYCIDGNGASISLPLDTPASSGAMWCYWLYQSQEVLVLPNRSSAMHIGDTIKVKVWTQRSNRNFLELLLKVRKLHPELSIGQIRYFKVFLCVFVH
uniref:INO80 complex subunit B-like conserved region domain-containing protein n=1 Tax=Timema cristinae TaxID=61476 RepID=A0A7R9CV97_TIMCR|nr:unnamed protein product [Timema cristinae]